MNNLQRQQIATTVGYIREQYSTLPEVGLVLGSGLGDFADSLNHRVVINAAKIPHYPVSTVEGHKGRLVLGDIANKGVVVFQGRIHFYESNNLDAVLYPIHIAGALGVRTLVITNAAGGINRSFSPGDLMLITDQLNLTGVNPLESPPSLLLRSTIYSPRGQSIAISTATDLSIRLVRGVYAGVKGPSYETAAEVEMIHRIGGDAVGMSTVLEVSLATTLGIEVLGVSCITNHATGIKQTKLDHSEVTEVANRVKMDFASLLSGVISRL